MDFAARGDIPLSLELQQKSAQAVVLVRPDGRITEGALAVFEILSVSSRLGALLLWLYHRVALLRIVCDWSYRRVANNRPFFSSLLRYWLGVSSETYGLALVRWLLVRGVALTYLVSFHSLAGQLIGLVGSSGILPVSRLLPQLQTYLGHDAYFYVPTLCWFNSSDGFLLFLAWGGVVLSVLMLLGIVPALSALGCWFFYLSLTVAGQDFLQYQWDALLLETGFLAFLLCPWTLRERHNRPLAPSLVVIWLWRFLALRFFFLNGIVKIFGDSSWRDLTALHYHYFTQPIPNPLSWYAHQMPPVCHELACAATLIIEIAIPWLIFAGRSARLYSALALIALQIAIGLTGNYAFFNWLAIVISISLLDDAFLRRWLPPWLLLRNSDQSPANPVARFAPWLYTIAGYCLGVIALVTFVDQFVPRLPDTPRFSCWNAPIHYVQPFRLVNHYGAFSVMTKERVEIIIEGSIDGVTWLPYEFKYKPGDIRRAPPFVAPWQPRLDWQMWFAALQPRGSAPVWFFSFIDRLLRGEPTVLALLKKNAFLGAPPKFVRARRYLYTFSTPQQREQTGQWWQREYDGVYFHVSRLR